MTVYEIELTEKDLTENTEEVGLHLEADELVTIPVGVPRDWDHQWLLNRDAPDSHPMEAITGLKAVGAKVDGIQDGAQVNVLETVMVNGVALPATDKTVDIYVPTSYGWSLDLTPEGTIYMRDKTGGVLSKIDTGLNRVVKSGYFDEDTVEIVLVMDDDNEIRINASSLVDIYTADGYYITETGREFGLSENAQRILTDSTKHNARRDNPHNVTKAQVGLSNVDDTSDADKPVSKAQKAAIDVKADDADLKAHVGNASNPHGVTKDQVGLGNVDDTADADKPVSGPQKAALDKKADATALSGHIADASNPHGVTKAQVGLGSVDNTADKDKPVSDAVREALAEKVDRIAGKGLSTEDYTTEDRSKLTGIAQGAQVNVIERISVNGTETEPSGKAVDIPVPTKVSDLANDMGFITKAVGDLAHYYSKADTYTKQEINALVAGGTVKFQKVDSLPETGASNVIYLLSKAGAEGVYDQYIYVDGAWELIGSTDMDIEVTNGTDGITVAGVSLQMATEAHPGLMTVEQVGALAGKAEKAPTDAHIASRSNPHGVTKAQVGLGSVDNTSDADKPVSILQQAALDKKADSTALAGLVPTSRKVNGKSLAADVTLTAADVGALSADTHIPEGSVVDPDFSETSVNPVQNKVITQKLKELATVAELDAHKGSTSNPHNVTKAQVGLGSVDNTADKDKPVSGPQQSALDKKADLSALDAHRNDKTNPHGVNKTQVGLDQVDNTSDADKPVSGPQQTALDGKVDKIPGKGLSAEDFTSSLKTKLTDLYTKTELDGKFASVAQWSTQVVDVLPATGKADTIYLVPKEGAGNDAHSEYLWVDGAWELIGSTEVSFPPATTEQDGLMTRQHVQRLAAAENGLSTAQDSIARLDTEQTTQDGRLNALEASVAEKVDKIPGKGLSSNDYTGDEKTKLEGIQAGAQVNTVDAYRGTFTGNGTARIFTVTHNLGRIPTAVLYKNGTMMLTDTEATESIVKFTFNTAPATGASFTAVIIG